jgi:hypothetical protein
LFASSCRDGLAATLQDVLFPGLPDGLFSNQKFRFWSNLESLGIENVVIFCDHMEYFTAIWYTLQPFDIGCGHLVHFFRYGMFGPRKIWQP